MNEDHDVDLVRMFVGLASTLTSSYDTVELVQSLVESCVQVLDVDAAGAMVSDQRGGMSVLASSSVGTRMLELFQLQTDQGPCAEAFRTARPVTVTDLAGTAGRWPTFTPAARSMGYAAVTALPLRLRDEVIGALTLFRTRTGALAVEEEHVAQALADTATIGILAERAFHHQGLLVEQLQGALASRTVIEQAKGVIAARAGLSVDQAFTLLRSYAKTHRRLLTDLASAVVSGDAETDDVISSGMSSDAHA